MEALMDIGVVSTIVIFVLVIVWIILPFAIFGIKSRLDNILLELKKTNALLTYLQKDTLPEESIVPSSLIEDKFKCRICSKSYGTEKAIRLHLESSHKLSGSEIEENIEKIQ
jgi:hypothetical protein